MKLKRLELQGFKSFPDKTEISFNEGITGIVGPNGSGKSNIGDAVRWVLGEQSARALRGAKMEDVIFGGTQKRKKASFCEVSLVFDNSDQALKSAFAEVQVTRRVYRNGEGEYFLNHASCRLRDILELFRDTGIGREGYSLIGQGRVDEILSGRSEDRRQVFEEAAGIMTFRVRKEEAERKLAKTGENLARVYDILTEIEGRLGPLYEQSETARAYRKLFDRLRGLEINIFLIRYDKTTERIKALTQTMEGLRDILMLHEAKLNELNAQREKLDQDVQSLEEALNEAREKEKERTERLHESELALAQLKNRKSALESGISQQDGQIEELRERIEALHGLDLQGSDNEDRLSAGLRQIELELSKAQQELEDCNADREQKEEALDQHKTMILEAANRLGDAREQQARRQVMKAQIEKRLTDLETSLESLKAAQETARVKANQIRNEKKQTEENYQKLVQDTEEKRAALDQVNHTLEEKGTEVQKRNLTLQADTSRLRLMTEMSREMEGYQQSVRRALEYAKGMSGVRGVLAKLISVPQQYETAIDMVLGGTLQNIVTDDENAAKRVIDYLRQNRLGRATFLPITTVKSRILTAQETRVLNMPGCLGVASEMISYDEAYRGIIENLLGRTIIADNLEHGIAIMREGHHAFRLVTLSGDVMHSGGSMTGGTVQGKTTSLLGREREIKELRVSIENQKTQLDSLRALVAKQVTERDEMLAEQSDILHALHQEEIAVARDTERLSNAEKECQAADQRMRLTLDAMEQLRDSVREVTEDLEKVESAVRNESVDREEMDKKTLLLQQEVQSAREASEKKREQVTALQLRVANESHSLDLLRQDKKRRDDEIARIGSQIERLTASRTQSETELAALSGEVTEKQKAFDAQKMDGEETSSRVRELDEQRKTLVQQQREVIRKADEIRDQYEEDSAKQHRTELALSKAENDLTQMCDHIMNAYELTYAGAEEMRSTEKFDLSAAEKEAASLRNQIREMGTVNVSSIEEYEKEKARYDELTAQRDDLLHAKDDLEQLISRLLKQMEKQFVGEFQKLGEYFSETFTRLFGGGQAELKLSDENDPLGCDIDIIAQPPGKKLQLLSLLSGGERALTAIAILFAMLKLKPTPFCILDEIEAALDEANISYFADYLVEYAKTTQFVVVSHRKGTMERCDSLYGVAMEERGVSRIVSVNLEDFEA